MDLLMYIYSAIVKFFIDALLQISPATYGIAPLDIIIVIIVLFYAHEGYTVGFVLAFADLASFVLSFIAALKFYNYVSQLLVYIFSMPLGFANAAGFFIAAILSEIILSILIRYLFNRIPPLPRGSLVYKIYKKANSILGLLPGVLSSLIVLSFILTIIVTLPSSPLVKNLVTGSSFGSKLIANTAFFEKQLDNVFGGAYNETLNFLTIEPQSDETIDLHFKVKDGIADSRAEQEMFGMVNAERIKNGLESLVFDKKLSELARQHSQDMFVRGYFSHNTPEGLSPFDRMTIAEIEFASAGENLALAPATELAMQGLMNSPGHRANILSASFNKIGIGVIDGGAYGMMFTQEFTN